MTSSKKEKIINIEKIENFEGYVYDLEIEGMHTFLANDIFVHNTDSVFILLNNQDWKVIDAKFEEFLKEWGQKWNVEKNLLVFEHEKVFEPMLFVMKKNYAYLFDGEITIKGMECVKSDSNIIASKLQSEFVTQVLNKNISPDWDTIIADLQLKVYNQQLVKEELIMVKALTKMPKDYAGDIIDKKTKTSKIKADGTIQKKAIPAHVKLAERMISQNIDLYPGSKIKYIIVKTKPNLALSPEEFEKKTGTYITKIKKKGEIEYEFSGEYDANYYWLRIIKPLVKVMNCYYQKIPEYNWNLTNAQLYKLINYEEEE